MDYFQRQERERKLRNEALPLHNRKYVIILERTNRKVEVVSVDNEMLAHAIFDAMLDVIDQQQANAMERNHRYFEFSLDMWRCSMSAPSRWTLLSATVPGYENGSIVRKSQPISIRATSGQFPLRGMNLDGYRERKEIG